MSYLACPKCAESYTVGPQVYHRNNLPWRGTKSTCSVTLRELFTFKPRTMFSTRYESGTQWYNSSISVHSTFSVHSTYFSTLYIFQYTLHISGTLYIFLVHSTYFSTLYIFLVHSTISVHSTFSLLLTHYTTEEVFHSILLLLLLLLLTHVHPLRGYFPGWLLLFVHVIIWSHVRHTPKGSNICRRGTLEEKSRKGLFCVFPVSVEQER